MSLNLRLAGFYFFYFAAAGILLPYWSPYLKHLGYSPQQIGVLLALAPASKLIAPYLWGWLADHTGRRMLIVRIACIATLLNFAAVYIARNEFYPLAAVILLYSFFWNAALPQFEATTLSHLGTQSRYYGRIRLWGSLGFILTTAAMGYFMESWGIAVLPPLALGLFIVLALNSLLIPEPPATADREQQGADIGQVICQPQVIAFFLTCFLIQASHGPFYAFFTIYMDTLGYPGTAIGAFWVLGIIVEIAIFLLMPRLLPRFGARFLMLLTLALTVLRWLLTAFFADIPAVLLIAQSLHGFSFGMYHAVSIHLVHHFFQGRLQGRGQALFGSLGFGLGGAAGNLLAGLLWAHAGAALSYLWAAGLAAIAFIIIWCGLSREAGAIPPQKTRRVCG